MLAQINDFIEFLFNTEGFQNHTHQQLSSFLEESRFTIRYMQSEKHRTMNEIQLYKDREIEHIREKQLLLNQVQEQQNRIHNLNKRFNKKLTFWERVTGKIK